MTARKTLNISNVFKETFRAMSEDWLALLAIAVPLAFIPTGISIAVDYLYIPNVVSDVLGNLIGRESRTVRNVETITQSNEELLWSTLIGFVITLILMLLLMILVTWRYASRRRVVPTGWPRLIATGIFGFPRLFFIFLVSGLLIGLGALLLIVPGLWLYTVLCLSLQIGVVERTGVFRTLGRSVELTEGNRWRVFAILLITFVVVQGGALAVAYGLGLLLQDIVGLGILAVFLTDGLISSAAYAVLSVFQAMFLAALYFELREGSEGIFTSEVSETFA